MKNASTPVYIYELRDPRDGKTYYVGKSVQPQMRFRQHIADGRSRIDTPKAQWLRTLEKEGTKPKLAIVGESTTTLWPVDEGRAIKEHLAAGSPLTNINRPKNSRPINLSQYADSRSQDYWDDLTVNLKHLKFRMYPLKVHGGYILQKLWNYGNQGWRHMEDRAQGLVQFYLREEWVNPRLREAQKKITAKERVRIDRMRAESEPGSFLGPPIFSEPTPFPTRRSMAQSDFRQEALVALVFDIERYEVSLTIDEMDPEDLGHSATAWRKEMYKQPSKGFNRSKY